MKPVEELDLLLTLIRKYELPISPILEYAVSEKKSEMASNLSIDEEEVSEKTSVSDGNVESSDAYQLAMQELEVLRKENEYLRRRYLLLEKEMKNTSNFEYVLSLQKLEESLCSNAKLMLALPIEKLPFSNHTLKILRAANVRYFKEIPQLALRQVLQFRNCGVKTTTELRRYLAKYSLDFGMTYEEIVTRLSKYVDDDFDSSLFVNQNAWEPADKESARKKNIVESPEEEIAENNEEVLDADVEHVFLDSNVENEETSTLTICSENRSGMPWSSEEEEQISNYYNQGYSFTAIAKAIGRSKVAVMSRLGMLGLIDYAYGQEYMPESPDTNSFSDEEEEETEESEFDGKALADRYYYPLQDNLFWDKNDQVYEIYLADNYDLIINHLIFDFDLLNEIEIKSEGLSEDEREKLFSNYWYDNHINVIARIKPKTDDYDNLILETGSNIQEIVYDPGNYVYIKYILNDKVKFIDYNGIVYNSPEAVMATQITDVAKYHDFYDAPKYTTKEYIRFGMIEIRRIYNGAVKKVTIFADSDLGKVLKDNSEEIWMFDTCAIITKKETDENNSYPFTVYFRNGVRIDNGSMPNVKIKSLILQAQLNERINKLQSSLKKKKEWIRFERQLKEIESTMFYFKEEDNDNKNSDSDNSKE